MAVGPKNKLDSHPKGCRCPDHKQYAKLARQGNALVRKILVAARKKNLDKVERIATELEQVHEDVFRLRHG